MGIRDLSVFFALSSRTMSMPISEHPEERPFPTTGTMPALARSHKVLFYDSDEVLVHAVARYLSRGLRAGQPGLVVATVSHRRAIEEQLQAFGHDVERLTLDADLIFLDARNTLASFMSGPMPDRLLFEQTVGEVFRSILKRRAGTVVRAFGEMVDILHREGNASGAIAVEALWNGLIRRYAFSLLCAYSDGTALRTADPERYLEICRAHDLERDLTL